MFYFTPCAEIPTCLVWPGDVTGVVIVIFPSCILIPLLLCASVPTLIAADVTTRLLPGSLPVVTGLVPLLLLARRLLESAQLDSVALTGRTGAEPLGLLGRIGAPSVARRAVTALLVVATITVIVTLQHNQHDITWLFTRDRVPIETKCAWSRIGRGMITTRSTTADDLINTQRYRTSSRSSR